MTIDRISASLYMELMLSQFPEFTSFQRNQKVFIWNGGFTGSFSYARAS
jgi:hypothetical protein